MAKRKAIRNAVRDALKGRTVAGQTVLTSRYAAIFSETFPLILIYWPEEIIDSPHVNFPRTYERKLTLMISGIAPATADIDDVLDDFSDAIEAVLGADPTFGGLAMGSMLKKINSEVNIDSDQQLGAVHLTLELEYLE